MFLMFNKPAFCHPLEETPGDLKTLRGVLQHPALCLWWISILS
jgi:hypothetical protein